MMQRYQVEEEAIIDLSGIWLVTSRIVGDLDMTNLLQMALHGLCEVSLHFLHMIHVVLDLEIIGSNLLQKSQGIGYRRVVGSCQP
jgi:hypothetical protein